MYLKIAGQTGCHSLTDFSSETSDFYNFLYLKCTLEEKKWGLRQFDGK